MEKDESGEVCGSDRLENPESLSSCLHLMTEVETNGSVLMEEPHQLKTLSWQVSYVR
jgi:hypothetical protein